MYPSSFWLYMQLSSWYIYTVAVYTPDFASQKSKEKKFLLCCWSYWGWIAMIHHQSRPDTYIKLVCYRYYTLEKWVRCWWWMSRWKIELRQRRGPKGSRWRTRVKKKLDSTKRETQYAGHKSITSFYFFFSPRLLCYCRCCCSIPFDYMWSRVWHIQTKSGAHPN